MQPKPNVTEAPTLIVDVLRQFTRLMQDELALAKAEISRNVSRAVAGVAMIVVAAIILLVALNVLAGALVGYLAQTSLSAGTAALVVGGGLILIAVILAFVGKSRLGADALEPDRTIKNVKRDIDTLKEPQNV